MSKYSEYSGNLDLSQVWYKVRKYNGFSAILSWTSGVPYFHTGKLSYVSRLNVADLKAYSIYGSIYGELWKEDDLYKVKSALHGDWNGLKFIPYGVENMTMLSFIQTSRELKHRAVNLSDIIIPEYTKIESLDQCVLEPNTEGNVYLHQFYVPDSTNNLSNLVYKHKPFYDHEATVIGYTKGKGKYSKVTGAIIFQLTWKDRVEGIFGGSPEMKGKTVEFNCSSGLSDSLRGNAELYFPISSTVMLYFNSVTPNGVPVSPRIGYRIYEDSTRDYTHS